MILSRTSRGSSFATRGPHEALLSAVVYLPLVLPVDISRRCCSLHAHQPNASTLLSSTLSPFFFTSSSSSFLLPLLPARPACLYGHEDGPSNSAATQHLPSSITCRSHHSRTAYIFFISCHNCDKTKYQCACSVCVYFIYFYVLYRGNWAKKNHWMTCSIWK